MLGFGNDMPSGSRGAVDECVLRSPSVVILRACTEIIESPSFGSDQKALAYKYRGVARVGAGAVQPAIADFTESIRLKKEDALAFAGRAWARFTDKDLPGSPIIAKRSTPHPPPPHYTLSVVTLTS